MVDCQTCARFYRSQRAPHFDQQAKLGAGFLGGLTGPQEKVGVVGMYSGFPSRVMAGFL